MTEPYVEKACAGCGAPLRVERGLNTCDTDECPGNLPARFGWPEASLPPALPESDDLSDAAVWRRANPITEAGKYVHASRSTPVKEDS